MLRSEGTPAELAAVWEQAVKASRQREATLKATGRLTEEQAAGRVQAPGRLIGGAAYEKPTPGKLGIPSQALLKARGRVDRLQAVYDRALSRSTVKSIETIGETRYG